jgi:hypothetical protein
MGASQALLEMVLGTSSVHVCVVADCRLLRLLLLLLLLL